MPVTDFVSHPEHLKILEEWMKSYRSEDLFDRNGKLIAELAELAPKGTRRMGANPHANGGLLLKDLVIPDFRAYAVDVPTPGSVNAEATRVLGKFLRDVMKQNAEAKNLRVFGPDETASNRLEALYSDRQGFHGAAITHGRASVRQRSGYGGLERAHVRGLAGRLSAHGAARLLLLLRSLHSHH